MTQVCIAGMHRSGTSMVARLLNLCGLYLGHESDISITAADNPEGFWENYHFVQLNDAILSGLGGAWDMPPVLQKGWETEPSSLAHQAAAEELIGQFTDCEAWGWKDPRNSLTIDLWRKVLPELKVIICLRNPLEVVQSLSKRGYSSTAFGFNLWFAYNAHLVETIPPEARIITHYEAYFSDPRAELERLLEFTGIEASEEQIRAALKSINRPLRHNRVKFLDLLDEHPDLEVVKLYQDMCLQAGPVSQKLAAESQVVTDISRGEYEQYIINRQRERLADRLAAAQSQLAAQDQKIRLLTSQIEEDRRAYQARMEEDRRAYQARMDEENQAYRDLWARTQHLQGLVQRLRREINQMQATRAFRLISRYRSFRDRLRSTAANIFLNNPSALDRPSQKPASELQAAPARPSPATPPPPAEIAAAPAGAFRGDVSKRYEEAYTQLASIATDRPDQDFVPLGTEDLAAKDLPVKALAFYLPQFHPIPENDEWWGKGFTEWTNVSKAVPQFVGHYQPRLPGELGFYDLRVPETQRRQIQLAKKYGIYGFCIHYYWFNGKRLLEKPLDQFLKMSGNDLPFCLCWANENWTRRWDGQEDEILLAQSHSPESDLRFIRDLIPLLEDPRYIRVNGRPLLVVYRPNILPDVLHTVESWRNYCTKAGLPDPYLVAAQTFGFNDPREVGFDAAVEFPPHTTVPLKHLTPTLQVLNPWYRGNVVSYRDFAAAYSEDSDPPYKLFKTVFPSWDNEARKPGRGLTFALSTPSAYQEWLTRACEMTVSKEPDPDKRLVFINAWNEWGEGAYLEPDRRYGYAYLEATARALKSLQAHGNDYPQMIEAPKS